MIYLMAFLLPGIACLIAQLILDNTKFTPGHITSLFTVFGALLSFLGVYDLLIKYCGAGATILISNFGHLLYIGGINGYNESGVLGIFSGILSLGSFAIVAAIVFSFLFVILFKAKD